MGRGTSRKSTSWKGDSPASLHREYRALIEPLCREQGWTFVRQRGSRKPYVVSPAGRRYTLPVSPEDSYLAVKRTRSALRRMGAEL